MGKYNFSALRVRQTVVNQKAQGKFDKLPEWVDVIGQIPPSQVVVRHLPQRHPISVQRMKQKPGDKSPVVKNHIRDQKIKPSRMFQPLPIRFEEDKLRSDFFRDHPWELARPRIVVEGTGKDFERYDWSRIQQPGKQLDGESVVQRQLWLLHNVPNLTKGDAYDIARREFYLLRQRQDIERRVAAEEAEATGATFGPLRLDIGMELENQEYENWKAWARSEAQAEIQKTAMPAGVQAAEPAAEDYRPEEAVEDEVTANV